MEQSVLELYLKHHAIGDQKVIRYLIYAGSRYSNLNEYYFYKI